MTVLDPAQAADLPAALDAVDPFDVRFALGADGLLRDFNRAGALVAADVHVASRLGRLCGVHVPVDERPSLFSQALLLGLGVCLRGLAARNRAYQLAQPSPRISGSGSARGSRQALPLVAS